MIRLETFFTTNLVLDKPNFFNTIANTAFSPLQHLPFCGQKQYKSLNGRATLLAELSPVFRKTVVKTSFFFLLAIVATPVAVLARLASLYSSDVSLAFTSILISKTKDPVAKMNLIGKLPLQIRLPILEELKEELKQQKKADELSKYLLPVTRWLENLESVLEAAKNKEAVQQWLEAAQQKSNYLHPFAFAESMQFILARLKPREEFVRFHQLMTSCSEKLRTLGLTPEAPLQNQVQELQKIIKDSFIENARLILALSKQQQNPDGIAELFKGQKAQTDYPYPFYMVPLLLPLAKKLQIKNLEAFENTYRGCKEVLSKQTDLAFYITEAPPEDHTRTSIVLKSIAKLQNIQRIESWFASLTSSLPLNNPLN